MQWATTACRLELDVYNSLTGQGNLLNFPGVKYTVVLQLGQALCFGAEMLLGSVGLVLK